jgi:hypothetical protein
LGWLLLRQHLRCQRALLVMALLLLLLLAVMLLAVLQLVRGVLLLQSQGL